MNPPHSKRCARFVAVEKFAKRLECVRLQRRSSRGTDPSPFQGLRANLFGKFSP